MVTFHFREVALLVRFQSPHPFYFSERRIYTGNLNLGILIPKIESLMNTWFGGLMTDSSAAMWLRVLTFGLGLSIGVVFIWWGLRKVTAIIMGAFRNGHLKM